MLRRLRTPVLLGSAAVAAAALPSRAQESACAPPAAAAVSDVTDVPAVVGSSLHDDGDAFRDHPTAIAVGADGSVVVAAVFEGPRTPDDFDAPDLGLVKLSPAGDVAWTARHDYAHVTIVDGLPAPAAFRGAADVAVAADGTVYVLVAAPTFTGGEATLLAFGADGALLWERIREGDGSEFSVSNLAVDPEGGCYVAAWLPGAIADRSEVSAYAADGSLRWRKRSDAGDTVPSYVCALAVGPDGSVHATGDAPDVVTWDRNGALRWSRDASGSLCTVTTDAAGRVFAGGNDPAPSGHNRGVVRAYDAQGAALWSALQSDAPDVSSVACLAATGDGGVWAGGTRGFRGHVVRYDAAGCAVFELPLLGARSRWATATDVRVADDGTAGVLLAESPAFSGPKALRGTGATTLLRVRDDGAIDASVSRSTAGRDPRFATGRLGAADDEGAFVVCHDVTERRAAPGRGKVESFRTERFGPATASAGGVAKMPRRRRLSLGTVTATAGNTALGPYRVQTLRIRNTSATEPLVVRFAAPDAPFFAGAGPYTVAPRGRLSADVRFQPSVAGPASGTLRVETSDPAQTGPIDFVLTGRGK